MLKQFENWLIEQNYSALTSKDYVGRIERLCRKEEKFSLSYLVENITTILPEYEDQGKKSSYGKRSHTSVKQALGKFNKFLNTQYLVSETH